MIAPEIHEHVWVIVETGRCDDGHDFTISECSCGAEKHEWPSTEEYILNDWVNGHQVKALITHHYGALMLVAQSVYIQSRLLAVLTERPLVDPGLN